MNQTERVLIAAAIVYACITIFAVGVLVGLLAIGWRAGLPTVF